MIFFRTKRKIPLFVFVLILIIGGWLYLNRGNKNKETLDYKLGNKTYKLLIANSSSEWEKGLMNVRKLNNADGMVFLFPDKRMRTFWNKNTLVDLDVYWYDGETLVGKSFLPAITKSKKIVTVTSPEPVNKVVELINVL